MTDGAGLTTQGGSAAPASVALVVNPTAAKGGAVRNLPGVTGRLRDAGHAVEVLLSRSPAEAADLVASAAASGADVVAVMGGDGMAHLGLNAVARRAAEHPGSAPALGLVPAGTGNDVARYFGLPRADAAAATDVVIGGRERQVDLARVGSRYFLTVLAAGFDAVVNERANEMRWPRGQMRYNLATLAELRTFRPIPYVLEVDGVEHRFEAMMVAVGNGPSYGGGLRMAEGAVIDDGLLDVVAILPMSKASLVRTYPKLFKGTHVHHPEYRHHHARTVTIAAPGVTAYADGERIASLPLTVEVVPGALRVIVPAEQVPA